MPNTGLTITLIITRFRPCSSHPSYSVKSEVGCFLVICTTFVRHVNALDFLTKREIFVGLNQQGFVRQMYNGDVATISLERIGLTNVRHLYNTSTTIVGQLYNTCTTRV